MICPDCGKPIGEDSRFCSNCGARIAPAEKTEEVTEPVEAAEEAAAAPEESMAEDAEAAGEELPEEAEQAAPEAEVTEEADEAAEYVTDMDADAIMDEILNAPAEEAEELPEAPVPVKPKKTRKKLWAILIPILVVVLLAAAAGGVYFMARSTYAQAVACVEAKQYEQAIALFEKFSFYGDSKEQVAELNRLQKAYDEAAALAQANNYVSAIGVLSQLGDYRDSKELMEITLPYARAGYLMASAVTSDAAAYTQHPDYQEGTAIPENLNIALYEGAASLYLAMGDQADAADLASGCYSQIAYIYMEQGLFEDALGCRTFLNEADNAAVLEKYMTYCADTDALTALANAVRVRSALEQALADQLVDAEQEAEDEDTQTNEETEEVPPEEEKITYLDLVDAELEALAAFQEDLLYYDADLKEQVALYLKALEKELSALDEDGNCKNLADWYAGSAMRCQVIETLIDTYDFLSDNTALQASFAGKSAQYGAWSAVEKELTLQITGYNAQNTEEDGDFFPFENTTGYTFTLTVYNEFFDKENKTVFYHETDPVTIAEGETVNIPFMMPTDDEKWETRTITWKYEVALN